MKRIVKLDLNGHGCDYLYRSLPEGGHFSLGEIKPPVQYGGKYRVHYRGLHSEHDSRQLALASVEELEQARAKKGIPPQVFAYEPTQH